jgi:hypothetical protein
VVAKHPNRLGGDSVSPAPMMLHPLVTAGAVASACGALLLNGAAAAVSMGVSVAFVLGLVAERAAAGVSAARRFRDWTPLLFPGVHLLRNLAWVAAIVVWVARRLLRISTRPSHSMPRRRSGSATGRWRNPFPAADR